MPICVWTALEASFGQKGQKTATETNACRDSITCVCVCVCVCVCPHSALASGGLVCLLLCVCLSKLSALHQIPPFSSSPGELSLLPGLTFKNCFDAKRGCRKGERKSSPLHPFIPLERGVRWYSPHFTSPGECISCTSFRERERERERRHSEYL